MTKGLEDLKVLKKLASVYAGDKYAQVITEDIEKELKALEIIKTKRVDIPMFYEIVNTVDKMFACVRYNQETTEKTLTQEEFDLLEEVLKNVKYL